MPLIKDLCRAIDTNDVQYWNNCTPEEKAGFPLWTYQRYCSSLANNADYALVMTNELVNVNFQLLQKDHPELVWMSMALTGTGKVGFHSWIKPPKGSGKKDPVTEWLISINPLLKNDEVEMLGSVNSDEELIEHAKALGYDDEKIKEIFGLGKQRRKSK